MVANAKSSPMSLPPQVELRITEDGCEIIRNASKKVFPIHAVSYGVQVSNAYTYSTIITFVFENNRNEYIYNNNTLFVYRI